MQLNIKKLFKHFSQKDILILSGGTIIAQSIVFLSSPILSRIYTPEAFGILSVFTAVSVLLACLSTGKYELAIFAPKEDQEALQLLHAALKIVFAFSFIVLFVILFYQSPFQTLLRWDSKTGSLLYLIPIVVLQVGVFSFFQLWTQRKKFYKTSSIVGVFQSLTTIGTSITFGLISTSQFGLVYGYIVGQSVAVIILSILMKESGLFKRYSFTKLQLKNSLMKHKRYPLFVLPSEFLLLLSQQFLPLIYTILFPASIVGYISFSLRILRVPSIVVANAFWGVYRNDLISVSHDKAKMRQLFLSTFRKLFFIGLIPFSALALLAPWLFGWIFGSQWIPAGDYGRILSLVLFSEFIAFPLNSTFLVLQREKSYFAFQFLNIIVGVLIIVITANLWHNGLIALTYYSLFLCSLNCFQIFWSYKLLK
ncbi:MAG: oligosaccharide flippase family protein [Bacteroidetes bacterium]|nr:oligosaccharide flippase family protein [Bacteroidota bacterium]